MYLRLCVWYILHRVGKVTLLDIIMGTTVIFWSWSLGRNQKCATARLQRLNHKQNTLRDKLRRQCCHLMFEVEYYNE